ncbi:YqzL family protein [Alkalibacillus silvisoli]|uniref:YqzL family protein n=1 Tax=Alkalibacillus silvisoli TaxID=392823 RepID=A0ABN0ZSK9_9BACI
MFDIPWKVFEKTGNVEAYLLMKQVEDLKSHTPKDSHSKDLSTLNPKT